MPRTAPGYRNGTSPRTRGKHPYQSRPGPTCRNIPAHAGKTERRDFNDVTRKEHPRARGENPHSITLITIKIGTSPRTRGKRWVVSMVGIALPEHPRARGENGLGELARGSNKGTSPRTRGKLICSSPKTCSIRNIPAHAGKTGFDYFAAAAHWEHPRARGENVRLEILLGLRDRNIPAHAGKTNASGYPPPPRQEHPRARGENCYMSYATIAENGTSPRTRGKRF